MNLNDITTKPYILALIIRDDGERLLLGDGSYDFKDNLQHFQADTFVNDVVELQGADGQLLAGQVRRSTTQKFNGYIGDSSMSKQKIEALRRDFLMFFRKKHFYKVVYIFCDGSAIQRKRGYIVNAPTAPEMWQKFPEYSIGLNFEDTNYYEYEEDEFGDEIYAHIVQLALAKALEGGLVWDAIGAVTNGITWSNILSASGEYISIDNALDRMAPLASVEMLGNATQSGTPTPDSPVPVEVVTGENMVKIEGSDDSQEFEVNLGKNLLDPTWMTPGFMNSVGGGIVTSQTQAEMACTEFIPVEPGTEYTFEIFETTDTYPEWYGISQYTNASTNGFIERSVKTNASSGYWTFRTKTNTHYIRPSARNLQHATKYQLSLGGRTTYAPYFTPIELAKIGNYQDRIYKADGKWYIHKEIAKRTFDGAENWGLYTGKSHTFTTNLGSGVKAMDGLCDHFAKGYASSFDTRPCFYPFNTANIIFSYPDMTDVAAFKTWLASNPTTVYYALATPTTTEITDSTLLAQLNALGNAKLYVGQNNIGTTTLNAVPTLKIDYYSTYDEDGTGYEWEPGGGGQNIITIEGIDDTQPIWTVTGPALNPTLTNITTGQTISWQGFVPIGQTLTIDMADMTADLAGANVFEFITGEWIQLRPGNNTLVYTADGGAEADSTLSWNGVAS